MKVKFCEKNKGKSKAISMLKDKYPDVEISIKKCLGECHACSEAPMAIVNHKLIVGKDKDDLCDKIVKALAKK